MKILLKQLVLDGIMNHINRIEDLALVNISCPNCGFNEKRFCRAREMVACYKCGLSGIICVRYNSKGCRFLEVEWAYYEF